MVEIALHCWIGFWFTRSSLDFYSW